MQVAVEVLKIVLMKPLFKTLLLTSLFLPLSGIIYSQTICSGETILHTETFGNTPFAEAFNDSVTSFKLMKDVMPEQGEYAVAPVSGLRPEWHNMNDHTGDHDGNMLLINPGELDGDFYAATFENLTPLKFYSISLFALNINKPGSCGNGDMPQVKIVIEYTNGILAYQQLSSFTSNFIQSDNNPAWQRINCGFFLPAGINRIRYRIINNSITTCGNAIAIDDISFSQCAGLNTLPVKNLQINNIETVSGSTRIQFSTTAEYQAEFMITEKSTDGLNWKAIQQQPAAGLSETTTNYITWDPELAPGTVYYRIRQTDIKGGESYSAIIKFNSNSSSNSLSVYPTPFTSQITLSFSSSKVETFTLSLYAVNGITVHQQQFQARKGTNVIQPTLGNLKNGQYYIRLTNAEGNIVLTQKTMKQ